MVNQISDKEVYPEEHRDEGSLSTHCAVRLKVARLNRCFIPQAHE